jgi:hypothetical protein
MAVTLPVDVLDRYTRLTLYNSPYAAHDRGHAVDLYPGDATHPDPADDDPVHVPSPVAGEVLDVRTVAAPSRPYAADEDHLLLVDTADGDGPAYTTADGDAPVARLLHVDPAVAPGDRVAVGDRLGELVRAGFFAPWVANHLHVGFRDRDADPYRAAGSLPLELDPALALEPVEWDGTGTVVAAGETYAVLDRPVHPEPGTFAGLAATVDRPEPPARNDTGTGVLDGGFPHYDGGGLLGGNRDRTGRTVRLLDVPVGTVAGRDVTWEGTDVYANGDPVRGIALSLARDELGTKLVGEHGLAVGTTVEVDIGTAGSGSGSESPPRSGSGAGTSE